MFQDRCYDRDNDMTANFFGDNNQITNEMNMAVNATVKKEYMSYLKLF